MGLIVAIFKSIFRLWAEDTNYYCVRLTGHVKRDILQQWIVENCTDIYTNNGSSYEWFFRTKDDATIFELRWVYEIEYKEALNWIKENKIDIKTEEGQMALKLRWM